MLSLPSIPQGLSDCERTLYISSLVPFENVSMVRLSDKLLLTNIFTIFICNIYYD